MASLSHPQLVGNLAAAKNSEPRTHHASTASLLRARSKANQRTPPVSQEDMIILWKDNYNLTTSGHQLPHPPTEATAD